MNISSPLADFTHPSFLYRLTHLQGRNEMIAKAVGYRKGVSLNIMDATAGLGREAFLLAALGCEVRLFERHPVIGAHLKEALLNASLDPNLALITARMTLHIQCAITALQDPEFNAPEVIYCDPMFSPRKKSAAVKKEMQVLQNVVGQDQDAEELVKIALHRAKKRVVVKRGLSDPTLVRTPDFTLKGKSQRFDIYIIV
jgi:16S rRNA (guanine1516-N2)-methyltransferase